MSLQRILMYAHIHFVVCTWWKSVNQIIVNRTVYRAKWML